MSFPIAHNETDRLKELESLQILDTEAEREFDDLTRLAAQICSVPIALVSLIDSERQWFKSKFGLEVSETPREQAFCAHTILGNEVFIVPNALDDKRFAENPLVTGDPSIRFYAGVPLITDTGHALGSLCVIDKTPRELLPAQKEALEALARQAMRLFKLRDESKKLTQANEKLKASEENYRIVSESASDVIITIDEESRIIYVNAAAERVFGYKTEELIGNQMTMIVPERMRAAHSAEMRRYMESGQENIPWSGINLPALRRGGREIQLEVSFGEYRQNDKRLFTGIMRDITERQIAEAKLQASEKRYRFLSESVPQQVWTARPDGLINYGNYRTVEYFGQKIKDELYGMKWEKIIHPDDLTHTEARWKHSVKTGEHYETEYRLRRSDGEYRWHLAQAKPMFDDDGTIIKWFGTNTDIHDRKMAEKTARETAEYRNLFQNANDAILLFEMDTEVVIDINEKACEIYRLERDEFIGKSLKDISQNPERGAVRLQELFDDGNSQSFETVQFRADGTPISLFINCSIIEYQGRKVVLSINRDITDRKKAQEELYESRQILQMVLDTIPNAVFWKDKDLNFLGCNRYMAKLMGLNDPSEIVGKNELDFSVDSAEAEAHQLCDNQVIETGMPQYDISETHTNPDGSVDWLNTNKVPLRDAQGDIIGMLSTFQDVTERKRAEEQLLHNALHDGLTGLPNRALFLEHLRHAIERNGTRGKKAFAVLFLDLDHFKIINDSLGHLEGDNLLCIIAQRLNNCLRPGDIVSRIGGDEFTILLDDLGESGDVIQIVERIQNSLKSPFNLRGSEVYTSASIGIALNDTNYTNPENMLRDADIAMYRAKANGKARHQIFDQTMHEQANYRLQVETELRHALKNNEFCLYYQPIINLKTNRIKGFESLVRWRHPKRGIVSPLEFIPIAEETGIIVPLGEWILRESCHQLRYWQSTNSSNQNLTMSVNLSCKQFMQSDLFERIFEIVRETKVEPNNLRLEITESYLMNDSDAAIAIMKKLRSLAIKLSIDDFGTGYSSLSYLHRLPINYLKIDRSFVSQMQSNAENFEIVRTIIMLAKNLNLKVIAEGIETPEQADFLRSLDCDYGQGFLYSKPVRAEQAAELIGSVFPASPMSPDAENINFELINEVTH